MIRFGIDVLILMLAAFLVLVVTSVVCVNRVSKDAGEAAILSSITTSFILIMTYAIAARVLDAMAGGGL